jgi:MFS family permease
MEVNANVPHAFGINTAVGICGIALCFLGGWLADRFGPKGRVPLMLISSLVLGISAPFFIHIISEGNPLLCFSLQLTMGIFLGIFGGSMQP